MSVSKLDAFDSATGYFTWFVRFNGRLRQDGGGTKCDADHARMIGKEIHDCTDQRPITIEIYKDGIPFETYDGEHWTRLKDELT